MTLAFESLLGKTIKKAWQENDQVIHILTDTGYFKLEHEQECCEEVYISDVCGELEALAGGLVVLAEEASNEVEEMEEGDEQCIPEYCMWTFYKLETSKGGVTIRWNGCSNGYYSVGVDLVEAKLDLQGEH